MTRNRLKSLTQGLTQREVDQQRWSDDGGRSPDPYPTPPITRNKAVLQTPGQWPITVGRLKTALAGVPDDHGLVPSQVYNLFVVGKDGHNKGYISASGELHWWPAAGVKPLPVLDPREVVPDRL